MASNPFHMTLTGNLTRDPELRFTPSGSPVATFSLAVNKNYQDKKTSEWIESTEFYRVTAWYKLAENIAESLKKGDRVFVIGQKLSASSYEKDGEQRTSLEITASSVAASLDYATCEIKRNPKSEYSGNFNQNKASSSGQEDIEFSTDDIPF